MIFNRYPYLLAGISMVMCAPACAQIFGFDKSFDGLDDGIGGANEITNGGSAATASPSKTSSGSGISSAGVAGATSTGGTGGITSAGGAGGVTSTGGTGGANSSTTGAGGNGWSCVTGTTKTCYSGPPGTEGKGVCRSGSQVCENGTWGVCQDEITPSAIDVCNGVDDDCDGVTDNGNPGGGATCSTGKLGACASGTTACSVGAIVCNQSQQAIAEVCDGIDNDCDGVTDNGNPGGGATCSTGKPGACAAGTTKCSAGAVVCNQIQQAIAEVCDGVDNDCDGTTDNGNPSGGAACSTGKLGVCAAGTTECAAGVIVCKQSQQASAEVCDSADNNCDGVTDNGNPGGGATCSTGKLGVCAAGTTACTAGAIVCNQTQQASAEVCDGADNNCDGVTDNGNPGGGVTCSTGKLGVCAAGTTACIAGAIICNQSQQASAEVCDGADNDCNGVADNGNPGSGAACSTGKPGVCATGTTACSAGAIVCNQNQQATAEVCDGLDNNCNGTLDEGTDGAFCATGGKGICSSGHQVCETGDLICEPDNSPAASEIFCNGLDDNCNGMIDECFVAGTRIAMADGSEREIERVNVGDWVLGFDLVSKRVVVAPVAHVFIHPLHARSRAIVRVNEDLRVTTNHPFYANGRWIPAGALSPGDSLVTIDGLGEADMRASLGTVSSLVFESERETTYNIEVTGIHDYFAGGILVHNKPQCP